MSSDLKFFIETPSLNRDGLRVSGQKSKKLRVEDMKGKELQEQAKPYTRVTTPVKKFRSRAGERKMVSPARFQRGTFAY
jgi:hypothetical protein